MKKLIYKLGMLTLAASLFVSCDEETVVYKGGSFVQFTESVASETVATTEAAGTLKIPVSLSTAHSGEVTVTFEVTSDDAVAGVNYNVLTPTLVFAAGETDKDFEIAIIDDDDFNLARTVNVKIASATPSTVSIGIANKATDVSIVKDIRISNDDYDCDTDFNYWLGALTVTTSSGDAGNRTATGTGGVNCDILTVNANLAGWTNSTPDTNAYDITFAAGASSGSGEVSVSTVVDDAYAYSATQTFMIKYEATGTYDTTTGFITLSYSVNAYVGATNQGYFDRGTTVIKLAN